MCAHFHRNTHSGQAGKTQILFAQFCPDKSYIGQLESYIGQLESYIGQLELYRY